MEPIQEVHFSINRMLHRSKIGYFKKLKGLHRSHVFIGNIYESLSGSMGAS
jgi:hypothetical protein